jgi:hypothetical protein
MPIVRQELCAKCRGVKGKANRWWLVKVSHHRVAIEPLVERKSLAPFEEIYCGESCVVQVISEFMRSQHGYSDQNPERSLGSE